VSASAAGMRFASEVLKTATDAHFDIYTTRNAASQAKKHWRTPTETSVGIETLPCSSRLTYGRFCPHFGTMGIGKGVPQALLPRRDHRLSGLWPVFVTAFAAL